MNERLIRILACRNPDPRDIELVLLIAIYVAISLILYYTSVTIVQSRIIAYSEELMFTFATCLGECILSLFR